MPCINRAKQLKRCGLELSELNTYWIQDSKTSQIKWNLKNRSYQQKILFVDQIMQVIDQKIQ